VKRRVLLGIAGLLFALGGWQVGAAVWIHAKAALAQVLIQQAWAEVQDGQKPARPWPWADTTPVARLEVPVLGVDQIVLAGASGRTIAFGPGHMDGTPMPGAPGLSVISAHRDTHFRFLRDLAPGQAIVLTDAKKTAHRFRVTEARVVDSETAALAVADDTPRLALVTCYPFGTIRPGGPLRYIVFADPEPLESVGLAAR